VLKPKSDRIHLLIRLSLLVQYIMDGKAMEYLKEGKVIEDDLVLG